MKAEIIRAQWEHIQPIAENVREADRLELWAAAMHTPTQTMESSLKISDMAWTGLIDGIPVCMFGVAPVGFIGNVGRPWMVGTDLLDKYPFVFLRRCRKCVKMMLDLYPMLENYVDLRNKKAIGWLKWLGFSFGNPASAGPYGVEFVKFWMGRIG